MNDLKQYLLTVIAGASICAILSKIHIKSTANTALIKLLSEIFLIILIISPVVKFRLDDLTEFFQRNDIAVTYAISEGEAYTQTQTDSLIKQSVAAYILDKARSLHADIRAEVVLSQTAPQIPVSVVIYGDVSPYTKTVLQSMIANELGVPEEAQVWN